MTTPSPQVHPLPRQSGQDPLRLLILEDSPADAELLEQSLRRAGVHFTAVRCETREQFVAALGSLCPDAVLADFRLPHFDGLQALRLVREQDPDLPFLFVTGAMGDEAAVELLFQGANDAIIKDRLSRLPASLQRALEAARHKRELRAAQRSLAASEARFRAILETTPDWIWELDADGRVVYASPACETLLGCPPGDLLGRPFVALMTGEDRARLAEQLARPLAGLPTLRSLESRCRDAAGVVRVLESSAMPILDEAGRWLGHRGTSRDVTELRRREAHLETLVKTLPDLVWMKDPSGVYLACNPMFERYFGCTEAALVGHRDADFPDSALAVALGELALHDPVASMNGIRELWVTCAQNGRQALLEMITTALPGEAGEPPGVLGVARDITDRRQAETEVAHTRAHLEELVEQRTLALRRAEERSRLILESSADGLYGQDAEGRATFINPAACKLLGYTPEQVLGRSMHALIHHSRDDGIPYPESECPICAMLRTECEVRHDGDVFWRADGSAFPVSYSAHPIHQDGKLAGAVVSFFDISARKQSEAARDAALAEAQRLARLKSEFLANMSHEIRTPLNAVLGFAQIGYRDNDGRKAQDFFRRILDSGQLLLGIVNDILDFSKIEAGKLTVEQGVIELPRLVSGVIEQGQGMARDKGLTLHAELAADLPGWCRGDGLRVQQVLTNLVSNAVKFTERGEVRLAVWRESERLCLRVADTGIGMSPEQVARLFSPFEQADGSITRRFGGTGLGLAITKRLVEMMGGSIQVSSAVGMGSCFELWLPLAACEASADDGAAAPVFPVPVSAVPPSADGKRLDGLLVLVAEDNATNRLVLEEMLNAEGCWLVQVENGLEALERVRRDGAAAFDLVLMDVQMPVMDGFEATRRLRELAPELPVIGLTAHVLQAERAQCLAVGMVDHVAKPVELEALVATLLRHWRRSVPGRGTRVRGAPLPVVNDRPPCVVAADPTDPDPATWVDWSALAARYARNPDFLPKLLTTLIETNAGHADLLRDLARQGDLKQVAFMAHELKGAAGNLFATALCELARATETSARRGEAEAAALAQQLADALDGLLGEVRVHQWVVAPAAGGGRQVSSDGFAAVVEQLRALLAMDDTEANRLFERHQHQFSAVFGDGVQQLGTAIGRFEYQQALATLSGLCATWEQGGADCSTARSTRLPLH